MITQVPVPILWLLLLWGLPLMGWSQGFGLSPGLLPRAAPTEVAAVLPEPAQLDAQWWRYFQADTPEELARRVDNMQARLNELTTELPPDVLSSAQPFIDLLRAHLTALVLAKAQASPKMTPASPPPERFTVSTVLAIHQQWRELQGRVQQDQREVTEAEQTFKASQRQLDGLSAQYSAVTTNNSRKLLLGLELMAKRLELAVVDERLRVRRAAQAVSEAQLSDQEKLLAAARRQVKADDRMATELPQLVAQADAALTRAREEVFRARNQAVTKIANTAVDRAEARLLKQQLVGASVSEVAAEAALLQLQALWPLENLLQTAGATVDLRALREQRQGWISRLQALNALVIQLADDSERERGRLGELPTSETDLIEANRLNAIEQRRVRQIQDNLVAIERLRENLAQTQLLMELLGDQLLLLEGRLSDWLDRGQQNIAYLLNELRSWALTTLFRLGETPVTALGLLRVLLIVAIAWWLSYWFRRGLQQLGEHSDEADASAYNTIGRLSHYLIVLVGFVVGLTSIGVDFTNFALVASALAIGIGFGMQSIVNNFISGMILLFERTLKVGDFVELASGVVGEVRYINVRSTVINTNDNVDIVVPNSEFVNTNVTNWTLIENYRRIHLPFRVAYGTDKELVKQAGLEAAEKVPHTLTGLPGKTPGVWLVNFGDNGLEFELVVWITHRAVKRPAAVHAAYLWEIETALRKYGIRVPLPQRDLHLKSGFEAAPPDTPSGAVQLTRRSSDKTEGADKIMLDKAPIAPREPQFWRDEDR